jgi:hypothetical protein
MNTNYSDIVEKELLDKCEDIPFSNSLYQDESFVLNTSYTDARAIRNVGLALSARVRALKELEFGLETMQVDLEEIDFKLKNTQDQFELRRLDIEKRKKQSGLAYTMKLLKDSLYEIEYFRAILAKLPKLTRQEFEDQEKQYFIESLTRQAVGLSEPDKSLAAMGLKERPKVEITPKTLSEKLNISVTSVLENISLPSQEKIFKLSEGEK